jgi:hypothetical protein
MTTFKNIFGQVIKEIANPMTTTEAEKYANYTNSKAKKTELKIVEVDFNNGSFLFL